MGKRLTQLEILKRFKKIHKAKYNYSKIKYRNLKSKVEIICSKHGSFFQMPFHHISGCGCPKCALEKNFSKGESKIKDFLEKNNIFFKSQYIFEKCKNIKVLPFDFYLPDKNILIEYDGEQHYKPVKHFGGKKTFIKTQKRDKIKNEFAKKEKINLIRISYKNFKSIEEILIKIIS